MPRKPFKKLRQRTTDGFSASRRPGAMPSSKAGAASSSVKPGRTSPPVSSPSFPKYYSSYTILPSTSSPPVANKTKKRWKKIVLRSGLVTLAVVLGVGGWLGWKGLHNLNKVFHGNLLSDAQALFSNTKLKGEDQGRVNILLAGDSADDPHHGGAQLTDSIMVVSIDTRNHTGFILSIPRDLWVYIPGVGHEKINAANNATSFNQPGYPKGGMGQLEQVVQEELGIPINYYALINYTAFKDAVNAVGGINITIQSPDPRGLYDPNINKTDGGPLRLPNGVVALDGQTALNLARARGDPTADGRVGYGFPAGDFDRTTHQRQMLVALEQKAASAGVLANPVKVGQLFDALGKNVITDLTLPEVSRAVQIGKSIDVAKLQSVTFSSSGSNPLLMSYLAPDGESALIPKAGIDSFGQLQQYYQALINNNPLAKESPSVVILNASSITGLAHKEANVLLAKGYNVAGVADANHEYASTMVVDNAQGQKPASKARLLQLFPGLSTNSLTASPQATEAQGYTADFVVILGQNWNTGH